MTLHSQAFDLFIFVILGLSSFFFRSGYGWTLRSATSPRERGARKGGTNTAKPHRRKRAKTSQDFTKIYLKNLPRALKKGIMFLLVGFLFLFSIRG